MSNRGPLHRFLPSFLSQIFFFFSPFHGAIATRGETVCHRRTTRKYKSWRTGEPSHRLSRAINENKTSTAKVEPLFATRPSLLIHRPDLLSRSVTEGGGARNEKRVRFYVLARASQFFYVSNDFHETLHRARDRGTWVERHEFVDSVR